MVGTGKGAEVGILFRNAEALERLGGVQTVVLDKTGTLTEGRPRVTDVVRVAGALDEDRLLALAAAAELGSEHALGDALVRHVRDERGLGLPPVEEFDATPGEESVRPSTGRRFTSGAPGSSMRPASMRDRWSKPPSHSPHRAAARSSSPSMDVPWRSSGSPTPSGRARPTRSWNSGGSGSMS